MAKDRWSLRNIYMYLVCLITLIMVIVAAVGLVRSSVELAYPDPGYYMDKPLDDDGEPVYSEEEWERQMEAQEASSRRYAVLSLVGNAAMVLIAGPLYVYHWRKIEVEHIDKPAVEQATGA
ncbi:MAG: hypothetical protein JXA36_00680 [Coriobacteriia bacterium]|nr:hypothetical protein [Coriobacteriia bacterium]